MFRFCLGFFRFVLGFLGCFRDFLGIIRDFGVFFRDPLVAAGPERTYKVFTQALTREFLNMGFSKILKSKKLGIFVNQILN